MLLIDVVQQMTRSQRMLCAHRWGVDSSTPMILAERVLVEDVAARLVRRVAKAGAPNLGRLLVEYAGVGISEQDSLSAEAAVVRDWGLLLEDGKKWSMPIDLAMAASSERKKEHLLLSALLSFVSSKSLRSLAEALGVNLAGGQISQRVRLRQAIIDAFSESEASPDVKAAAKTTHGLGVLDVRALKSAEPVEGANGALFDVVIGEQTYRIAPREIAIALGFSFEEVSVEGVQPQPMALERVQALPMAEIGGLVVFQTAQMCDQAMHSKRMKEWSLEVSGARVLLKPSVDIQAVRDELLRIGYESVGLDGAGEIYAS